MKNKKHIVILSYLFPPHSHVGGRRQYFFAKYLAELGYKITVITADLPLKKNWNWETDLSFTEVIKLKQDANPKEYSTKQSFFNSIFWKLNNTSSNFLKRVAWKLGEFTLPQDFNNRLKFDEKALIEKLEPIDYIIATGGPWLMFEYGVRLKKTSQAKLILDYRDPWNAVRKEVFLDSLNNKGMFSSFLDKKSIRTEKNIIQNTDIVIAVSDAISKNCNELLNKEKTTTIYNGFDYSENTTKTRIKPNVFNITFSGQLRAEQDTSTLIKGLSKLLINNPEMKEQLKINFIGTQVSPKDVVKKINNKELNSIMNITPFLPKEQAMLFLTETQLLLQISYKDKKGIVSSKLIQYLGINKPILLISNNDDIMEQIISETETGQICKTPEEVAIFIRNSFLEWKNNQEVTFNPNLKKVYYFSFKHQVSLFNKLLINNEEKNMKC